MADRFHQVTLAYNSCGCAYFPGGPYDYEAAIYVNGGFVEFQRSWDAAGIAAGERNWLTFTFAGSSPFQSGQTVSFVLYRYYEPTDEYTSLGATNAVVVN